MQFQGYISVAEWNEIPQAKYFGWVVETGLQAHLVSFCLSNNLEWLPMEFQPADLLTKPAVALHNSISSAIWRLNIETNHGETQFEALQDTVYIWQPLFCICWTRTLRLKITATDPTFQRCRLLVMLFCVLLLNVLFVTEKVGKMAFFCAVKSRRLSSHAYYS